MYRKSRRSVQEVYGKSMGSIKKVYRKEIVTLWKVNWKLAMALTLTLAQYERIHVQLYPGITRCKMICTSANLLSFIFETIDKHLV